MDKQTRRAGNKHITEGPPRKYSTKWKSAVDEFSEKHPWLWRKERFKLCCTEFLAKWFKIKIDW